MTLDEQCGRRAASGKAAAANVSEHQRAADWAQVKFCRAGFAGRGTAFARSTERHTLAAPLGPRQSLGPIYTRAECTRSERRWWRSTL
jgi:hypothetical protein